MSAGLVCIRCAKFLRCRKIGITIEEGMPRGPKPPAGEPEQWGPYKLWACDLYECPECGFQLATGFPTRPIAEHFMDTYPSMVERYRPLVRVDDCGGAKP